MLLVQLGTAGDYTARATYAKSFFETAGLHVVAYDDAGDAESLRGAVAEAQAGLGCLCSTDSIYSRARGRGAEGAGRGPPYGAGMWPAIRGPWPPRSEPAGADRLIYAGCDVLDALDEALSVAGVG